MTATKFWTIVCDSREQLPLPLAETARTTGLPFPARRGTLAQGDYAVEGAEDLALIERKSLPDLIACIGFERARFERALARMAESCRYPILLVEGSTAEVLQHRYRSRIHPSAVIGSLSSWVLDHRIRVIFTGSREASAHFALRSFAAALRRLAREPGAAVPSGGLDAESANR